MNVALQDAPAWKAACREGGILWAGPGSGITTGTMSESVVGLIGFPLGHSISPLFQQAAFDYYRLPVRYESWETPPEQIPAMIQRLRQTDCLGCNVTIPHKQVVMPLLDNVDRLATRIGAVNTIVRSDGRLLGYNTDAAGFSEALRRDGEVDPAGQRVLVLGAGGAARAVLVALLDAQCAKIVVVNRDGARAASLVADLADPRLSIGSLDPNNATLAPKDVELIINTTSVGMRHWSTEGRSPLPGHWVQKDHFVYDLVYNPSETPLLAEARTVGARAIGGLMMLIYQGAAAFERWTSQPAPVALMRETAERALRNTD